MRIMRWIWSVIIFFSSILSLHGSDALSSLKLGGAYPFDVEIGNGYAYVAIFNEGIAVVDISDIYHPKLIKKIPLDGSFGGLHGAAMDLSLVEDRLYVALGGEGFALIDVSDPAHPYLLGHLDSSEEYNSVAVDLYDHQAFLGSGQSGVVDLYSTDGGIHKKTRFSLEATAYYQPLRVWTKSHNFGGSLKYSDLFVAGRENGLFFYRKSLDAPWDGERDPNYHLDRDIGNIAPIDFENFLLFGGGKVYTLNLRKAIEGYSDALKEVQCGDGRWDSCVGDGEVGVQELDGGWNTGLIANGMKFIDLFDHGKYLKRLRTSCDGGIDLDTNYLYCGNKSTKSLEIYALGLKDLPWDLNGDGTPDIVLHNRKNGQIKAYLLNHEMIPHIRKIKKLSSSQWSGWGHPVDFDRDDKIAILFRNAKNGKIGRVVLGDTSTYDYFYSFLSPGRDWLPVAIAEDNDDRYDDIFLRDRKHGRVKILDIHHLTDQGYPRVIATINPGSKAWKLLKVGKLNRDTTIALLFYHPMQGKVKIYYRDRWTPSHYRVKEFSVPNPKHWSVVAVEDINGDGRADLLCRRKGDGAFRVLLVGKGKEISKKSLGRLGGEAWEFVALTKIDRDHYPEIVLQNVETGTVKIVKMTKDSKIRSQKKIVIGGETWSIRRIQDLDKNGFQDLILQNRQDGEILLCLVKRGMKVKKKVLSGMGASWKILGNIESRQ